MTLDPPPFSRIKIRTSALVFCGDEVALIRRERADSVHCTTIGGNVEDGEPLPEALRRELAEELALDLDQAQGGTHEIGTIAWVDYRETADLPLFPPIGPALAALADPHTPVTDAALEAVTDANYTWVRSGRGHADAAPGRAIFPGSALT